jgi:hypothetical protein
MTPTDRPKTTTERRPYEKPELKEFGRLAELTRNTTGQGMGDGTPQGLLKTSGV